MKLAPLVSVVVLHACLFRINIEVPVDTAALTVALLKPLIALGEVMALELQDVSLFIHQPCIH